MASLYGGGFGGGFGNDGGFGGGGGFGNDGGFGGGGFMPSQGAGVEEIGGQTTANPVPKRSDGSQTLFPMTCKQLADAIKTDNEDQDEFFVDGREIKNVTIVGKIVSAEVAESSLFYNVDDGTGVAPVRFWNDSDDPEYIAGLKEKWAVGNYVRVYGHLREVQGQWQMPAFSMRPLTDFNELTFHLIECIKTHAERVKKNGGIPGTNQAAAVGAQKIIGNGANNTTGNTFTNGGFQSHDQSGNPCLHAVEEFFNSPAAQRSDHGLSIREAQQALQTHFKANQVFEAIQNLVENGLLYSTIDDEHYKSTSV